MIWLYKLTRLVIPFSFYIFTLANRSLSFTHNITYMTIYIMFNNHFFPFISNIMIFNHWLSSFSFLKCILIFRITMEQFIRFKIIFSNPNIRFINFIFLILLLIISFTFEFAMSIINRAFMFGSMTGTNLTHTMMIMSSHKRWRSWFF